jgi:hypothetical protein
VRHPVTSETPGELHIGVDAEKIVVSPLPIKMRSGRARRVRAGSVTEVVPVAASGRSSLDRAHFASQLALVLLVLSAVLTVLGIPWWAAAAGSAVLVAFVVLEQARAARPALLAVPAGEDSHVLWAPEERLAYEKALAVSRRIRRTWPELRDLIDPAHADRTLTRALEQLAALLTRRQEIRRLRAELTEAARADLPAESPARHALAAQRERVETLWQETGRTANWMMAGITAAAQAGESVLREQRISRAAREAELAISRLAAGGPAPAAEAGSELAERTAAVVAAYRELAAL